jgi:hypothetical protein
MAKGGPGDDALREATEELYGVDPADFVAARNELVKGLRREGERDLAAKVGKLRRPTPAAWAINQLVRRDPEGVEDLVRRGEELRAAQDRALAGAHADDLREAARARRDVVAALSDTAAGFLTERGVGADAHRNEITATLEAASLDHAAAAAVQGGRLSTALEPPSGFGDLEAAVAASAAVAPARSGRDASESPDSEARAAAEARRLARGLATQARTLRERVSRRRRELEEAEAEVATLERRLADARRRRDEAVRQAEEAEEAASRAEAAAAEAESRLDEASS